VAAADDEREEEDESEFVTNISEFVIDIEEFERDLIVMRGRKRMTVSS